MRHCAALRCVHIRGPVRMSICIPVRYAPYAYPSALRAQEDEGVGGRPSTPGGQPGGGAGAGSALTAAGGPPMRGVDHRLRAYVRPQRRALACVWRWRLSVCTGACVHGASGRNTRVHLSV